MESIGQYLRRHREERAMSVEEVSRATRIPVGNLERLENDHFDDLPGEVFVRGFLKAYARAVSISVDDVLARYTSSRRVAWVTPLPMTSPIQKTQGRRFGVAIAFVVLLILFTLALSIVLKPRGRDVPSELHPLPASRSNHGYVSPLHGARFARSSSRSCTMAKRM
jgi:cytoskeletal protein RodZ